jgi:hypothetical protein
MPAEWREKMNRRKISKIAVFADNGTRTNCRIIPRRAKQGDSLPIFAESLAPAHTKI